jgi:hypothetical protein
VLILVEGQTEERFVKDVLQPHLSPLGIYPIPTIVATKRVKHGRNFKGGVSSFGKVEHDLRRLLSDSDAALVTTMLDYYGLPSDFPGLDCLTGRTGIERAMKLEAALEVHFNNRSRFKAYFMVHELESMLYSDITILPHVMNEVGMTSRFEADRNCYSTPEEINDGAETHPCQRIMNLFPAYRKLVHGPLALKRIGIDSIRKECHHFDDWLVRLEHLTQ